MLQNASLDALNFTMAGAREGFGPFLGVYLQHEGFDPARTGFAMGLAGIAGVLATAPLGALIDRVRTKRAAVALAVTGIALGACLIVSTRQLWVVALGQIVVGIADTSLAPIVAALTLGLVGPDRYADRVARNEAFNHAGNAANAALAGILGVLLGLGWVAAAIAVMAVLTTAAVATVDAGQIDHQMARGGRPESDRTWAVLFSSRPLLLLAAVVFLFQTANGAMLPFIAQALTAGGRDPSLTTGAMSVVAQVSMAGASLLVPRLARLAGHPRVLGVALLIVAVRGVLAAVSYDPVVVGLVQILEGLAMGLAGVAIPALVANMTCGTGHAGAGLGGVMMAYGAGAALSPVLAGVVAQTVGFHASFLALASVAVLGTMVWGIGRARQMRPLSDRNGDPQIRMS